MPAQNGPAHQEETDKMNIRKLLFAAGVAIAALPLAIPSSQAAGYLKGKTVTFIVGFGAGGGYDTYSRMLGPKFAEATGADVLVVNQPGAGGMSALNRMYYDPSSKLEMMLVNGTGAALQQILLKKAVKFDLTKMPILGIVDHSRWLWLVGPKSPYNSPADAIKSGKTMSWGGSGKISGLSDGAAMTCFAIGLKCNVVSGYKGSHAAALAVARGEMDALYVSETSAYNYVHAGDAKAISVVNRERSILFPNVPTIFEQVKLSPQQQWWVDYRATVEGLGRILVVPPSTPPEAVKELRAAAAKILSDPEFVEYANKKKRYIKYIPAETAGKMVEQVLHGLNDQQKAQISKVVLGK